MTAARDLKSARRDLDDLEKLARTLEAGLDGPASKIARKLRRGIEHLGTKLKMARKKVKVLE
jgi:hypothetical protein